MKTTPSRPQRCLAATAFALLTLTLLGCNQSHPGNWDEAKVEAKLQETLNLPSLDLTPSEGGFAGTGTDAEGQTYEVTVTQSAATKELSYVAKGDRGATEEGSMAVD